MCVYVCICVYIYIKICVWLLVLELWFTIFNYTMVLRCFESILGTVKAIWKMINHWQFRIGGRYLPYVSAHVRPMSVDCHNPNGLRISKNRLLMAPDIPIARQKFRSRIQNWTSQDDAGGCLHHDVSTCQALLGLHFARRSGDAHLRQAPRPGFFDKGMGHPGGEMWNGLPEKREPNH